ncbi:unnamed protein product [Allacma fusca]|uniref:Uncharacterized protein n=1 Tax=Allacma fusca TaxID=39272 RepID=A0A8J2P694_9HEXA|nr:unnamed protein product [Allacma fusca]
MDIVDHKGSDVYSIGRKEHADLATHLAIQGSLGRKDKHVAGEKDYLKSSNHSPGKFMGSNLSKNSITPIGDNQLVGLVVTDTAQMNHLTTVVEAGCDGGSRTGAKFLNKTSIEKVDTVVHMRSDSSGSTTGTVFNGVTNLRTNSVTMTTDLDHVYSPVDWDICNDPFFDD